MNEKVLTKKERREQIRSDLAAAKKASNRKDLWLKVLVGVVIALALGTFVFLLVNAKKANKPSVGELGQVTCTGDQCLRTHIKPGDPHPNYNSNPPSNGPHYPDWTACKIYDIEIVDEQAVHSLEHGAVWITYKDKTNTNLRDQLSQLVKEEGGSKLILSPRAKDDSVLALASWGRVLKLESFDKQKIEDYIKLYRNGSETPEPLAAC